MSCFGICLHEIKETSCLDYAYCTNDVDVQYVDPYSSIWHHCNGIQKYNPSYGTINYMPMKVTLKLDRAYDKLPYFAGYNNFNLGDLVKYLDVSNNRLIQFPTLASMPILNILNVSNNALIDAKLSAELRFPALEELDVSHNRIEDIRMSDMEFPFANLKKLNISYNNVVSLRDALFSELNELQYLDLSHNSLISLNAVTFEGLKNIIHLNLGHNKLQEINSSLFRFAKMQYVYLNNNEIHSIKFNDFNTMTHLRELDLSYNLISSIESNAFQNMLEVTSINLKHNMLSMLDTNIFINTKLLQGIDLSSNQIVSLSEGTFNGKNISIFDIRQNNLQGALMKGTFEGLYGVPELDISYQTLTSLEDYAFKGLQSLEVLLLNNNLIKNISQKSFKSLESLTRLDISNNEITVLDFDMSDLVRLNFLSIKNNRIKSISLTFFARTAALDFLDISNNNITKIEPHSLAGLNQLQNFVFYNNSLAGVLDDYTFEGLSALSILDISNTYITTIKNNSFNQMHDLHTLNISHSAIEDISFNSFVDTGKIDILDLSYNYLKTFKINTTSLNSLRTLYLSHNLIEVLAPIAGLDFLNCINLSFNKLKSLKDNEFSTLKQLSYVDISFNAHLKLNTTLIKNAENLKTLFISGIENDNTQFDGTSAFQITDLDMSKSNITNITAIGVKYCYELQSLVLNNNEVGKLEVGAFDNLTKLMSLEISYNNITFVQPGVFTDNYHLEYLNISHNRLSFLSYGVFRGLIHLTTLDISYNELKNIQSDRLYGVQNLRSLIVDFNKISRITSEDFSLELSILSIGGNPLPCNDLVNLKSKYKGTNITSIALGDNSKENIDGISCHGRIERKRAETHESVNANIDILSDIKDVLINISNKSINNDNTVYTGVDDSKFDNLINYFNKSNNIFQNTLQEFNKTIEMMIDLVNDTKYTHDTSNNNNVTNILLERILKMIVAKKTSVDATVNINGTNGNVLPLISKIREEFENSLIIEKENILADVNEKIASMKRMLENVPTSKLLTEQNTTNPEIVKQNSRLLFTEICITIILIMLICCIVYKIYDRIILTPRRRSYSTQHIAVLDNSNL
ncbi:unnamed protein product [Leptosia nina]|uniref:Uncharacterized protein n=1 Tax=Leptosia nina TaxID=320188 RepID=A0AAV1JY96_9NEOP